MKELCERVADEVGKVVVGRREAVETVMAAVALGGHVLLEGVPGVAKTLLADATARALGVEFRRVQFTPDMLPSDITGTVALRAGELRFQPGPVFANVLLADEVNRTPPKTQAALLEAMQEGQVTVDGESHPLPDPFLVLATQNPVEYEGTYPLPEAQVDRFMVRLSMGYPNAADEAGMLAGHEDGDRVLELGPVTDRTEVLETIETAHRVHASRALRDYIVALSRHTRADARVELGASPRAGLMLLRAAKARALLEGRDHALPDDVQALAETVLAHRIMLVPEAAGVERRQIVADAVASTPAL